MKDGIIIQARTGSTRLHNKILLPFYGEQRIIDILIENIRRACPDKQVILATTVRPQDDVLEQVARGAGIDCFRGDEDNVLDRFIRAAEAFGLDRFIRVCSDNPFLRPDTFQTFFDAFDEEPADYIAYGFADGRPTIKSHLGLFAELCLRRKNSISNTSRSIFILIPPTFTSDCCLCPKNWKDDSTCVSRWIQWTISCCFSVFMPSGLDTMDDFLLLQRLYAEWFEQTDRSLHALLRLVEAHPEYREKMLENIARNEK